MRLVSIVFHGKWIKSAWVIENKLINISIFSKMEQLSFFIIDTFIRLAPFDELPAFALLELRRARQGERVYIFSVRGDLSTLLETKGPPFSLRARRSILAKAGSNHSNGLLSYFKILNSVRSLRNSSIACAAGLVASK